MSATGSHVVLSLSSHVPKVWWFKIQGANMFFPFPPLFVLKVSLPWSPPPWRSHDFFSPFVLFTTWYDGYDVFLILFFCTMDMMNIFWFFVSIKCRPRGAMLFSLFPRMCLWCDGPPPQGALICSPQKYYSSRAKQALRGGGGGGGSRKPSGVKQTCNKGRKTEKNSTPIQCACRCLKC